MPRIFILNLFSIITAGVLTSGWFLYYTDWFEVVGGLLALGGILSWAAFVAKIIPEERVKEFQKYADERVLCNPKTWRITVAMLLILAAFGVCFGTLELRTRSRTGEYLVQVRRAGDQSEEKGEDYEAIPAGGTNRTLHNILSGRLLVHVNGYPTVEVSVSPFTRQTLVVPDSFVAPVVLLRPTMDLFDAAHGVPKFLSVSVMEGGKTVASYSMKFDGCAVWVGCDNDVEVPNKVLDAWQKELVSTASLDKPLGTYFLKWARPSSLFRESIEVRSSHGALKTLRLKTGQQLIVIVFKDEKMTEKYSGPTEILVESRSRWEDFPQVRILD